MIVFNHPDVSCWVIERAGCDGNLSPSLVTSIGVLRDGEIKGGVVYHNYTGEGGSICIHSAGDEDNWTTRTFFRLIFDYPFNQLRVKRLIGMVPSPNQRALKINLKLGFKAEGLIRGAFPNGDMIILCMDREDCVWLERRMRELVH